MTRLFRWFYLTNKRGWYGMETWVLNVPIQWSHSHATHCPEIAQGTCPCVPRWERVR